VSRTPRRKFPFFGGFNQPTPAGLTRGGVEAPAI